MTTQLSDLKLLTTPEVAEALRIPEATIRYWRHTGTGPKSVKFGRRVMYRREDVEAYVDAAFEAADCKD